MKSTRLTAAILVMALAFAPLAGCGKKGKLELPPPPHQKTKEKSGS